MSYTNPQQIVDTQSAQHLANLQQTITGTFANVAANYAAQKKEEQAEIKKRQEENTKIIKANQDEEDLIRYNYQKYKADNPELNLPEVLPAFIDQYSNIKNALDLGTITDPTERARLRNELAKLKTLPEQIVNGIKAFSELSITYKGTYGKIGTEGGIDIEQTDSKTLKAVNIFLNNTPGTRKIDVSKDKNGDYNVDYIIQETDEKGNPVGEPTIYPQAYFRDLLAGKIKGSIVIVPDKTKTLEATDGLISTKDPLTNKKQYNKDFLETKTINRGGYIDMVEVVNINKVKAHVFNSLSSDINSMEPSDLVAYYNNILDPSAKNKITVAALKGENRAELIKKATDLYVDRYAKRFDSYEEVISRKPIDSVVKPKTDYSDVTDVVNSITQGNYDALANYGNISSIGKVQRPQKKGENTIKVLYNVGTSGLGEANYNLKDRTSLAALAAKIFVGSSQDNTERRKEFVNQMISNSNIGTKSNPLIYTP